MNATGKQKQNVSLTTTEIVGIIAAEYASTSPYEILSDENKRQIYDICGMVGLTSGLELGPKLNKVEEIKEELKRLRCSKELEKLAHLRPTASIMANLSLPQFLDGDSIIRGMAMV